jgi:predicted transposase YdaD
MDSLLKQLVTTNSHDFASWMLGCEVTHVEPRPTEWLPEATPLRSDLLFEVMLPDGRKTMLHFEFQGRSTHKPMPRRMLKYITYAVDDYWDIPILSCVFYTGYRAGANDTGIHQVRDSAGNVTLLWRYHVVHLWKIDAEELLALGRPGVLALLGQTIIRDSQNVLAQAITIIKQVEDPEKRKTILTILTVLMTDDMIMRKAEEI